MKILFLKKKKFTQIFQLWYTTVQYFKKGKFNYSFKTKTKYNDKKQKNGERML